MRKTHSGLTANTEEEHRRLLWRVIREVVFDTAHLDLHLYADLPDLVWSSFENFHDHYKSILSKRKLEDVLPAHLLARPLIGSEKEHDARSPLFSSYRNKKDLNLINRQVHFFRMYVALSNRLRVVTDEAEGAISRRLLGNTDPTHFCYVFHRSKGSKVKIKYREGIKIEPLPEQLAFAQAIEETRIYWPKLGIADLRDLSNAPEASEKQYNAACGNLDPKVFDLLVGNDKSYALVAWWIHRAKTDFVLFRGFDKGRKIDPNYTWGGVWFLFNSKVVGDHLRALSLLVHECFNIAAIEMRAREITKEKERANIGAGMFHNLAHYILPLAVYGRSIGRFVKIENYPAVIATASNIEDTVNRLARFQSAVMRYVRQRKDQGVQETLENLPAEALLIQTRGVHAALSWFTQDAGAGIGRKYLSILCDLATTDRELDPDRSADRKEAKDRLAHLAENDVPSASKLQELTDWWKSTFDLNIVVEGDFEHLKGDVFLIVGVVEELLLNALCAGAAVLAQARRKKLNTSVAQLDHLRVRTAVDGERNVIYIENVALGPLKKNLLFATPQGDKGWGLYGTWLLIREAGGDLDVSLDGKQGEDAGNWPLNVGFKITLPGHRK